MASQNHQFNYSFDLENRFVLVEIPFNFFLAYKSSDESITIDRDRIEFIKEMVERLLLEEKDPRTSGN